MRISDTTVVGNAGEAIKIIPTVTPATESYVRRSYIEPRPGDGPLFATLEDGITRAYLDGYAVIPMERYQALLLEKSSPTSPPESSAGT